MVNSQDRAEKDKVLRKMGGRKNHDSEDFKGRKDR
jgi:hypothetical protein